MLSWVDSLVGKVACYVSMGTSSSRACIKAGYNDVGGGQQVLRVTGSGWGQWHRLDGFQWSKVL